MENELALIQPTELTLVENNSLNPNQLKHILKRTPTQYVKQRPAKGGGTWRYVTGGYVKKCLNLMFGWDWDFEITSYIIQFDEAIVQGKLTARSNGKPIIKTQFGNKDIAYKKQTDIEKQNGVARIPLSIGNDLKAAATDCLKKCASEIGIAADIYNADDFIELNVNNSKITANDLRELLNLKEESLSESEILDAERIIKNNETNSFEKLHKNLINK